MHQFVKFIFGIRFYMFRTVPLSIIRSFSLYTQQWYMSYKFADSCQLISIHPGHCPGCHKGLATPPLFNTPYVCIGQ